MLLFTLAPMHHSDILEQTSSKLMILGTKMAQPCGVLASLPARRFLDLVKVCSLGPIWLFGTPTHIVVAYELSEAIAGSTANLAICCSSSVTETRYKLGYIFMYARTCAYLMLRVRIAVAPSSLQRTGSNVQASVGTVALFCVHTLYMHADRNRHLVELEVELRTEQMVPRGHADYPDTPLSMLLRCYARLNTIKELDIPC